MNQTHKNNHYDDDDDSYDDVSCFQQNLIKIIVTICLTIVAIGSSVALSIVLFKQIQRERILHEKKDKWTTRLDECESILKVVGPIVKTIIKIAFSILLI